MRLKQHGVKLAISLALAAAFAWLLNRGALPWLPDKAALAAARWWALPSYVAIWSVVHVLRAGRWHFLLVPLGNVSFRKLMAASFVGFAAIVLLPMRAGEVVRPALVRDRGKLSGWTAMGTIGAERILDGLFLSLMLLVGLAASEVLSPLPERIGHLNVSPAIVPQVASAALLIFAAAFAAMALFYFARVTARRLVEGALGWVSPRLGAWLADRITKVTEGLSFLPQGRLTLAFAFTTGIYWGLNAVAGVLLAWGVGLPSMTFAQSCVLTGVLALGVMVPNSPGFFGAFQFSVYAALALFFPERQLLTQGSVLVFFLYVGQMLVTFGAAALGGLMLRGSPKLGDDWEEDEAVALEPRATPEGSPPPSPRPASAKAD